MEENSSDDIQAETHASNNEDQLRILDMLDRDEALNGLEEDADSERKQKGSVEEGTEQAGALPSEREILRGLAFARDLVRKVSRGSGAQEEE
jgi:hypothetical protein